MNIQRIMVKTIQAIFLIIITTTLPLKAFASHWVLFDNIDTKVVDQTDTNIDLTFRNQADMSNNTAYVKSFNGIDQDVFTATAGALQSTSVTLSAWVNPRENNEWQWIASQGDNYGLYITHFGRAFFYIRNGQDSWVIAHSHDTSLSYNQWQLITGVYDATKNKLEIFIDGRITGSNELDSSTQGIVYVDDGFTIGSMQGERFFQGEINQVFTFDYPLSRDEIKQQAMAGWESDANDDASNDNTPTTDWQVVPSSTLRYLRLTTYDISEHISYGDNPRNTEEMDELYEAVKDSPLGTSQIKEINSPQNEDNNPHGSGDYYLSYISGYIWIPKTGEYEFSIDGDDAVDLFIDHQYVLGWYGSHGNCGYDDTPDCYDQSLSKTMTLRAGLHTIKFRHEDSEYEDNYRLLWRHSNDSQDDNFQCDGAFRYGESWGWQPVAAEAFKGLTLTTFDISGLLEAGDDPANTEQMNLLFSQVEDNPLGTISIRQILAENISGNNPLGEEDYYLSLIRGQLVVEEAGWYEFIIDGDDAIDVFIDDEYQAGWYGPHGRCDSEYFYYPRSCINHNYQLAGSERHASVLLTPGSHSIVFRHEETAYDDNYRLFWRHYHENGTEACPKDKELESVIFAER